MSRFRPRSRREVREIARSLEGTLVAKWTGVAFRSFVAAVVFALAIDFAACDGGLGGVDASAGSVAGGGAGGTSGMGGASGMAGPGGTGGLAGGGGACSEINYTRMMYSPVGTGGSGQTISTSQCIAFPAQCASDRHCSCVCPPDVGCDHGINFSCSCSESNGVVLLVCFYG
jgi:hypothetical protein